jgi:hypothetical protein
MSSGLLHRSTGGKWDIDLDNLVYAEHSYFHETNAYYSRLLEIALQGKRDKLNEEGQKAIDYTEQMEQLIQDVQNANMLYYGSRKANQK